MAIGTFQANGLINGRSGFLRTSNGPENTFRGVILPDIPCRGYRLPVDYLNVDYRALERGEITVADGDWGSRAI